MKTKLFGLVMALCLLAGAFAGMTVLAAETNLMSGTEDITWTLNYAANTSDEATKVTTLAQGQIHKSSGQVLEVGHDYRLDFTYATAATGALLRIQGNPGEKNLEGMGDITLPATGDIHAFKPYSVFFKFRPVTAGDAGIYMKIILPQGATPLAVKWAVTLVDLGLEEDLLPSEEGDTVQHITGGTQVPSANARVGAKMMQVAADNAMTMEFTSVFPRVKFRGFMKAEDMGVGDTVKVTFYQGAVAETDVIAEKTYTVSEADANLKDLQNDVWEYFRFSAMPGLCKIYLKVAVTSENGHVLVDGVTMEEDKNLLPDARFLDKENNGTSHWEMNAAWCKDDGDSPDGATYLQVTAASALQARSAGFVPVEANEKYLISFWYNTTGIADVFFNVRPKGGFGATAASGLETRSGETWSDFIYTSEGAGNLIRFGGMRSTGGKWEQVAALVTIPPNIASLKLLAYAKGGADLRLANVSIEKIDEPTTKFFMPTVMSSETNNTLMEYLEPYSFAFMTFLGKPVEVLEEIASTDVVATTLMPTLGGDTQKLSTDKVILATYDINENGEEQLVKITVGSAPQKGNSAIAGIVISDIYSRGFYRFDGSDTPLDYMNYPSASIAKADVNAADTMRAYCWNSLDGLKAVADFATIR